MSTPGNAGLERGDDNGLARRYQRLLLAYPRAYRRRHGTEILTTLLDAAPAGRPKPTRAEAFDLILGGLRQRFRLPVGKLMVVVAALVAIVAGGFGSAAGVWLAWRGAADLPDVASQQSIADTVFGERYKGLLFVPIPEHGGQVPGGVGYDVPAGWSIDAARTRLTAAGWDVEKVVWQRSFNDPRDALIATRDGVRMRVDQDEHLLMFAMWPARPALALPLAIAGLLAGAAAGWLLVARAGYVFRIDATAPRIAVATREAVLWWSPPVHRLAIALFTTVSLVTLLQQPVMLLYRGLTFLGSVEMDPLYGPGPGWYDMVFRLGATRLGLLSGGIAVLITVAAGVFFGPQRRPAPATAALAES